MGKARGRRIRFAVRQMNPLGVITGQLNDMMFNDIQNIEVAGNNSMGPIESIREQLQNANIEEKLNGLQALAVLTTSAENIVAICETDIIRIVAPLLCDANVAVRNAAAGALRNLSVNGVKVCEFLVDQDLLTSLLTLLNEYARDLEWRPIFDTQMCNQMDVRSDVYLQAINLLWNLCESTSVALDVLNQTQLIISFIRCLDYNVYGMDIAISVAQCLLVISEENSKSWNMLNDYVPNFLCLLNVGDSYSHLYLSSIVAGILSNVPALAAFYSGTIIQSLIKVLDENHEEALMRLIPITTAIRKPHEAPVIQLEMDTIDDETEEAATKRRRRDELPTEEDLAIRDVGYILNAQALAAEVITNLCGVEDEDCDNMNSDDDNLSDDDGESVIDGDITEEGVALNTEKLSKEICEIIRCGAVVEKLWKCSQAIDENLHSDLYDVNINLLIKVKNLRISSMLCLQNLCNYMCCKDLGGEEILYNIWSKLGQEVFKAPQDTMILESSTSLMRAALEHIKKHKNLFEQLTLADIELMQNGVLQCKITEVRANWLRMMGTLGCILNEELVKVIIFHITKNCSTEEDVWVLSEALDALMDMFADNDWPQIVESLKLVNVMLALKKRFKSRIRAQRKELKERYPAVQTVCQNLTRFIKYINK